jgi:thiol-disulfide isomerase/thioredoxin
MRRLALILLASMTGAAMASPPAPKVSIASLSDLPVVTRTPYDETANADKDVAAAFARARKSHKRVLIDLGGNWCGDCIVLSNIMMLPEVKPFVARHFEVVTVDVGRETRNLQIPARFGVDLKGGVPTVLVVEPNGKTLIDTGHIAALEDARSMTPQGIADWLAQWAK